MEKLFSKTIFPKALGGNLYEFKEAETSFEIPSNGFFVIKVIATAKNAKQNNSTDDDDLRMSVDDFSFGKFEQNETQLSWKGYNTSASWNGAILKGELKTIYFFLNLDKGTHTLKFFADNTPEIISIEVYEIENNEYRSDEIYSTKWVSFTFLGTYPKDMLISLREKLFSELSVAINGALLSSDRIVSMIDYKNDIILSNKDILGDLQFENSVELYCSNWSIVSRLKIKFLDLDELLLFIKDLVNIRKYMVGFALTSIIAFKLSLQTYSAKFLKHSLKDNPELLIFKANHPIVRKIKADSAFTLITQEIKNMIKDGILDGEIVPSNINFNSYDLSNAIHGIKKIEYKSELTRDKKYKVKIVIFDVYDFQKINLPPLFHPLKLLKSLVLKIIDFGEEFKIINNFEIQIFINIVL